MDRITAYLADANMGHREAEIRTCIARGARLVLAIMTHSWTVNEIRHHFAHDGSRPSARRARLQATSVMWYLAALAVERNQGFHDGAFLCRDPSGRLSAFFQSIGIPRASSHLKHHSGSPDSTGGVDLWSDSDGPDAAPLAHGHRHVLYIMIPANARRDRCLFLKPEHYGMAGIWNWTRHAVRYLRSLVLRHVVGASNVDRGMRKERIPDALVEEFRKAVEDFPDGPEAMAEAGRYDRGEGIGYMHGYLSRKAAESPRSISEEAYIRLLRLLLRLRSEYDFVDWRIGNEVVLNLPADLSGPLPSAPGIHGLLQPVLWP